MERKENALVFFRMLNKISQRDLAAYVGCTAAAISNFETGIRRPNFKHLIKIKNNDRGWDVTPLAEAYPEIFGYYTPTTGGTHIPVIPSDAMAGYLADYVNDGVTASQCEMITSPIPGATCAVRVYGDSMLPKYPSGSIVILKQIDPNVCIDYGKCFVLDTENGPMIKELRHCEDESRILCVSLNPDPKFHPFELLKSSVYGWYRVMMVMSFE